MTPLTRLYQEADKKGIDVYYYPMRSLTAISTPDGFIALDVDKLDSTLEETVLLAHEMGHCETGYFYTVDTPLSIRGRCEERADRWAIKRLVPFDQLELALLSGVSQPFELAELFNVTEAFIHKCLQYYRDVVGLLDRPDSGLPA